MDLFSLLQDADAQRTQWAAEWARLHSQFAASHREHMVAANESCQGGWDVAFGNFIRSGYCCPFGVFFPRVLYVTLPTCFKYLQVICKFLWKNEKYMNAYVYLHTLVCDDMVLVCQGLDWRSFLVRTCADCIFVGFAMKTCTWYW